MEGNKMWNDAIAYALDGLDRPYKPVQQGCRFSSRFVGRYVLLFLDDERDVARVESYVE
jgi:hypothetical protein